MQQSVTLTPQAGLMLPDIEPPLAAAAAQLAMHARPLLAASGAILLSLTMVRGAPSMPVATCWTYKHQRIDLRPLVANQGRALNRHLAGFEEAGEELVAQLAHRWPANAVPPAIGTVTDGGGVLFSPDCPSPLHPDWLALHQAGLCLPITVLPCRTDGNWTKLMEYAGHRNDQLNIYH